MKYLFIQILGDWLFKEINIVDYWGESIMKINTMYQTQWSAQFYVAAELTRRNYLVSLTLGNAPETDMLVTSSESENFRIDVKGQRTKNFWRFRKREVKRDLYYVLVYVPEKIDDPPLFFIASCKDLMKERHDYKEHIMSHSGKYHDQEGGMNWKRAFDYKDRWDKLPK